MNELELKLSKELEFALESNKEDLVDETFFAYNVYITSMEKHKLEFNKELYESLSAKYQKHILNRGFIK